MACPVLSGPMRRCHRRLYVGMHFFLYEWCSGGGLVNEPGTLPASLVREGVTMAGALAADLMRISGVRVTALRDPRVVQLSMHGGEIVDVQSAAEHLEEFERLAAAADATFVIAPEFDGILLKAARRVVALRRPPACRRRLSSFDSLPTSTRRASGSPRPDVPVPMGILLEPEQKLPADFSYPAVLKPVDGAGSQDTLLVAGPHDEPPPYAWPRRLERYMPGLAASVAFLCGPAGRVPLVPCKQRISEDGRLRYRGGELPLAAGLAERAVALADKSPGGPAGRTWLRRCRSCARDAIRAARRCRARSQSAANDFLRRPASGGQVKPRRGHDSCGRRGHHTRRVSHPVAGIRRRWQCKLPESLSWLAMYEARIFRCHYRSTTAVSCVIAVQLSHVVVLQQVACPVVRAVVHCPTTSHDTSTDHSSRIRE